MEKLKKKLGVGGEGGGNKAGGKREGKGGTYGGSTRANISQAEIRNIFDAHEHTNVHNMLNFISK